jgi:hypothetical protein
MKIKQRRRIIMIESMSPAQPRPTGQTRFEKKRKLSRHVGYFSHARRLISLKCICFSISKQDLIVLHEQVFIILQRQCWASNFICKVLPCPIPQRLVTSFACEFSVSLPMSPFKQPSRMCRRVFSKTFVCSR